MKPCNLAIFSKNPQSIDSFYFFFFNNIKPNFHLVKKYFQKKSKKKILTILKSPHINKTAQEQFKCQVFSKQYFIYSTQYSKYLIFLKRLKTNLFPDIKIKIKFIINKSNTNRFRIKIFDLNNFSGNFYKNLLYQKNKLKNLKNLSSGKYKKRNYSSIEKAKILMKILDLYGELTKSNSN